MPQAQAELRLPPRAEESEEGEQAREDRLHGVLLRHIAEAVDEVGRKNVCFAIDISEQLLGKQIREIEEKRPSYRLLAYLLKHQQSGRLARWLMADYAGYLAPQRPDRLKPEEFAREIVALACAGAFGSAEKQQVLDLYARMERPK